jgi:ketosteroid isomerase-like protein
VQLGHDLAAAPEFDVKSAYAAWDAAFNKKDAKAVARSMPTTRSFFRLPMKPSKGRPEWKNFFSGLFASGVTGHKLELIEAHGNGNLLFGAAKWSASGKDANGKDQPWGGLARTFLSGRAMAV